MSRSEDVPRKWKRAAALGVSLLVFLGAVSPAAHAEETPSQLAGLARYIEREFEKTHIPGMSVVIVDAEKVLLAESYGDCEGTDHPFVLGSLSKSFTAASVMQLAEQGKIDLSKPVAEYLPEVDGGCTVKQLLNQTSGIGTYSTLEQYSSSDIPTDYEYSNVNYGLLGKMVEKVSGMEYGAYLQKHLFEPLGMERSFVSLEDARRNGLTEGYRNYFGFPRREAAAYPTGKISGWLNLPSAYVIASAADMGRYLQFYLNGGGSVLSSESTAAMMQDTVPVQEGYEYGMGWGVDRRSGETIYTHGGNVEHYTTNMQILPERGLGIVVLFNACDYFVSNRLALRLAYNISYRLMGLETEDIEAADYAVSHLVIDLIFLAVLILCTLPLLLLKRWCRKHGSGLGKSGAAGLAVLHILLPTLILLVFPLFGLPTEVVRDFAPDVFLVRTAGSVLLYLTGLLKLAFLLRQYQKRKSVGRPV